MKLNWKLLVLVVFMFVSLGFIQDYVKINLNFYLQESAKIPQFFEKHADERSVLLNDLKSDIPFDYYYSHSMIEGLHRLDRSAIVSLKWFFTFAFVLAFGWIIVWVLKRMFPDERYFRWIVILYLGLMLVGGCIFVLGKLIGWNTYPFAHRIILFLQSPIPLVIVLPLILLKRNFPEINNE